LRALLRRRRRDGVPADELREKLAAQRSAEPEAAAPAPEPAPEPTPEPEAAAPQDDVETRRADVYAQAREKIDELKS
jgi:hypothetical protein